jgi:hypothetical protein
MEDLLSVTSLVTTNYRVRKSLTPITNIYYKKKIGGIQKYLFYHYLS